MGRIVGFDSFSAAKIRSLLRQQILNLDAEGLGHGHDVAERRVGGTVECRVTALEPLVGGAADAGAVSNVVLVEAALDTDALDVDAEGYCEAIPISGRSALRHVPRVGGLAINGAPYMVLFGRRAGPAGSTPPAELRACPDPCTEIPRECSMKRRAVLLPIVVTMLLGVAACASPAATEPSTAPSSPASAMPEPAPSTADSQHPSAVVELAEQERAVYMAMSGDEFAALPNEDKVRFTNLTNAIYMEEMVASFQSFPDAPKNDYFPARRDMTAQEASNFDTWQLRLAYSLSGDEREKYLQARLLNGRSSPAYPIFVEVMAAHPSGVQGYAIARNGLVPFVTTVALSEPQDNPDGSTSVLTSNTSSVDGGTSTYSIHYAEVTLSDGTVLGTWRRD